MYTLLAILFYVLWLFPSPDFMCIKPPPLFGAAPTRERAYSIDSETDIETSKKRRPTLVDEWIREGQVVDEKFTRLEATPEPEELSLAISKCLRLHNLYL